MYDHDEIIYAFREYYKLYFDITINTANHREEEIENLRPDIILRKTGETSIFKIIEVEVEDSAQDYLEESGQWVNYANLTPPLDILVPVLYKEIVKELVETVGIESEVLTCKYDSGSLIFDFNG